MASVQQTTQPQVGPIVYLPEYSTYNVGTTANPNPAATPIGAPLGAQPRPLPTSTNYVRPVKQHHGGLKNKVMDAVSRATGKAQRSWNEATDERFRRYFGFSFEERLFGEWWSDLWSGGQIYGCSCYVSTSYLCLLFKKKDGKEKSIVKATIALRDVTHIQRARSLPSTSGSVPVIQAINDPTVMCNAVIIYTCDGKMHQLCGFFNYDTFMHTLEWNWRTIKSNGTPSMIPENSGFPVANPNQPTLLKQTEVNKGMVGSSYVETTQHTATQLPHAP